MDAEELADVLSLDNDPYEYMQKQVSKDPRKHIIGDLKQKYDNWQSYKDTKIAKDSQRVLSLLPNSGAEVQVKDIKKSLIDHYGMEDSYTDKVIKEVGTQFKSVRCRKPSYTHENDNSQIYMRRKI